MKVTVSEEIEQVKSKRFILSVTETEYSVILALSALMPSTELAEYILQELKLTNTKMTKEFFHTHQSLYSILLSAVAEPGEGSHRAFVRAMESITRNAGE